MIYVVFILVVLKNTKGLPPPPEQSVSIVRFILIKNNHKGRELDPLKYFKYAIIQFFKNIMESSSKLRIFSAGLQS